MVNLIELAPGIYLNGKQSTDMCVKAAASFLKHSIESIPASEIAHLLELARSARFQIYAGMDAERFPRSEFEDLNLVAVKQYGTPMVTGANSPGKIECDQRS